MWPAKLLFFFSVLFLGFCWGSGAILFQAFPFEHLRDASKTLKALLDNQEPPVGRQPVEHTNIPVQGLDEKRWSTNTGGVPSVLITGGADFFSDHCPDHGCLAVAYNASGEVEQTWAYRPALFFREDLTRGAHQHEDPTSSLEKNLVVVGGEPYANGDILVTLQSANVFPYAVGVARVRPDGVPRWARVDYSHHWPTLRADETAWVPALKVAEENLVVRLGSGATAQVRELPCDNARPYLDVIRLLGTDGQIIREIELVPIFLESPWIGLLLETTDGCDPLHLNFIDEIGPGAGSGLAEGDLVVSLRNISRFIIVDQDDLLIKRVVAGGFLQQHSVQHLSGTKFLVFDNKGGDANGPPSRLIEVDIGTGKERRIFPNERTPAEFRELFSHWAGHIDISPDRSMALVSVTYVGKAFEIELETGRILAVFDNLHDLSFLDDSEDSPSGGAIRMPIHSVEYWPAK